MKRIIISFLSLILSVFFISRSPAQVSITDGMVISIDFNAYTGDGLRPSPALGQLDSDEWRITGLSDGDGTYAGTHEVADFARGTSSGGVSTGGSYAFEPTANDFSLGVQPTGSDWNSGSFDLRLVNNTGNTLTELNIQFDILVFNNGDRSNSFNFSYSDDDVFYTNVGSLDFASVETADVSPAWISSNRITSITDLNIANGGFLYLRWQGADISGSGSRDEFALDNILISEGDTPLPVELNSFKAIGKDGKVVLKWSTAAEVNNQGFIILRSDNKDTAYFEITSYKYNEDLIGAGTSSTLHNYSYVDESVFNGITYWYKLADVDFNGNMEEHGPISATPQVTSVIRDDPLAKSFALYQNYPNPFNPSTTITYDIPQLVDGKITVKILVFNILGQKVTELFRGNVNTGTYKLKWNGLDARGKVVPAGIYFYQIESEFFTQSKKMMYLK